MIDTDYDEQAIYAAIARSIRDDAFRAHSRSCPNPYGAGNAGPRIAEVLATQTLDTALIQKKMTY